MKNKSTPIRTARAYAAAHPGFEGKIIVSTLEATPGGQYMTRRDRHYWARAGQVAPARESFVVRNGQCKACGQIVLEPVLEPAYRDDDRAGTSLTHIENHLYVHHPVLIYAPKCGLTQVCPDCREALGLTPGRPRYDMTPLGQMPIVATPPGVVEPERPAEVHINLTRGEA